MTQRGCFMPENLGIALHPTCQTLKWHTRTTTTITAMRTNMGTSTIMPTGITTMRRLISIVHLPLAFRSMCCLF